MYNVHNNMYSLVLCLTHIWLSTMYSYLKLAPTNHHFLRNQNDCSSDQNLQITDKSIVGQLKKWAFSLISNLHIKLLIKVCEGKKYSTAVKIMYLT